MRLDSKVAIVTGGASGIGKAIGEELAGRGCEVVLADRQLELAEEVARGIRDRGGRARGVALDVRERVAFERLAQATVEKSGRIDFLFNNAGIAVGGEMSDYEPADWDEVFDVNIKGVANGIHAVYPIMIAQRSGHIVNTASVAGLVSAPGSGSYTASKHAVVGLTKALRIEAERHGVRASVLCPGAIRTPILTGGKFGRMRFAGATASDLLFHWERVRPMAPEALARATVDAMLRNEAIIVLPRWWKAIWWLDRLSPELSMRVWSRFFAGLRKDLESKGAADGSERMDRRDERVERGLGVRDRGLGAR